ncbi:type I-F CRISPR-associated endoribonuclease Cas6/Csy4 [Piscirickettsia litoralis]|uniref:Type I-F CRISPR-associated endoribonuclease Cas6/Csy4 n=1 Tax=Piscirickettsia litoralis TaxID=1891921 RepID=A0ABX3A8X8_9GAMM|nr:type I-F CRISPR-associated endoribonuclease Cas6/Csy4 [Piscirickettsia litoralis]ODN42584.1 type I-F CRISPR-associated endoribonuclease Cas6/Csy4 [Piscirickettsia litoralis]
MHFYINITLLPSSEVNENFLLSKVFACLHTELVNAKNINDKINIGLSFPEYSEEECKLGLKVRIFSPHREELEKLISQRLLSRLSDYLHMTRIREVPSGVTEYVRFKRVQSKSSKFRRVRRKARKASISFEEALDSYQGQDDVMLSGFPFIKMKSASSNQDFLLFVRRETSKELIDKGFNSYGLSSESTLPMF